MMKTIVFLSLVGLSTMPCFAQTPGISQAELDQAMDTCVQHRTKEAGAGHASVRPFIYAPGYNDKGECDRIIAEETARQAARESASQLSAVKSLAARIGQ